MDQAIQFNDNNNNNKIIYIFYTSIQMNSLRQFTLDVTPTWIFAFEVSFKNLIRGQTI